MKQPHQPTSSIIHDFEMCCLRFPFMVYPSLSTNQVGLDTRTARDQSTEKEAPEAVIFRTTLSSGTRLPWQRARSRGPGLFMSWAGSGQDKSSECHVFLIIGPHICSWICPNCEKGPRCQKIAYLGCRWDGGHWWCVYCILGSYTKVK